MLRNIAGVLAGCLCAAVVIAIIEMIAHANLSDDALFAAVALGYGIGAMAGASTAIRIAGTRWPGAAVAILLAVLATINLFALEHPGWFMPVAAVILLAGWWLGGRLAYRNHER